LKKNTSYDSIYAYFANLFSQDLDAAELAVSLESSFSEIAKLPNKMEIGEQLRRDFGSQFFASRFIKRMFEKPLGYAGDYMMMQITYDNTPMGSTPFELLMDKAALEFNGSYAVRNRTAYLCAKMAETLDLPEIKIMSVPSGSAVEIQHFLKQITPKQAKKMQIDLLDQDAESLAYAKSKVEAICKTRRLKPTINYIQKNVVRHKFEINYNLIFSAGLFDYFNDKVAKYVATNIYKVLSPGGVAIIGNFSLEHKTKDFIEILADWHLVYRTAQDLIRLYQDLDPNLKIDSEPLGVNLFAVLTKRAYDNIN
jgi:SAM-dependent methyltransferase